MRSAIQVSVLLLALGACLGLVTAQHRGEAMDGTVGLGTSEVGIVDDYDIETTGSIALAAVPRLSLSDEQRGFIFMGIINLPDVPEVAMQAPEPGVPLAPTINLHNIPAMVVRRIPEVDGYRFVKLEDRILLINAETRQVETMIPRYKLVFH
ncbi:MAG: hypothetical protein GEU95_09335 [Rhizobiales bacterium]|nr:hypothetical protein [Hyphomicrobiales bacterium]